MKRYLESTVPAELHRIRAAHQRKARKMGRDKYIEELNRKRDGFWAKT